MMEGHWSVLVLVVIACLGPPVCTYAVTVTTVAQRSAVEGADVQLTCTYTPHTTPEDFGYLAWSKDGSAFLTYECEQSCGLQASTATSPGKYDLNVDTTSSGNLTIFGVGLDDEATYMCSVLTSDLVVYSSTTQLIVDVPIQGLVVSDFRTTSYTNNSVVQIQGDQSYQFRCSLALPSKPRVAIEWEGEQINITMGDQVDEPSSDDSGLVTSYRVVHVTPGMQDSGKVLRCSASHPTTGQVVVSTVVLDVQVCPSSVMVHECPTSVNSGDSATLGCRSAATSPPPVLYWLYDGARVDNTSSEFRATIAEDIANVLSYTKQFEKADFNKEFVCCIESTAMCSQLCSEPCRPDILSPPSDVTVHSRIPLDSVVEGTRDLEVNCTASGNPMGASYTSWTRIDEAGNVVGPQRNAPLRFDAVSRADAGMYRCTVDNGVGSSHSTPTKVIVYPKPSPPTAVQFNQKVTTDTSLTVVWQPGHDGGAVQTFTVTSCLVGANQKCSVYRGLNDTRFEILALQSYSLYDVTVTGDNVFGESEASRPAQNSTAPLSPDRLGVVATYDIATGFITVKPKSNDTRPLPDDLCFGLEVKVIVARREDVCLKLNDPFRVETEVTDSQIWVLSCGRGVCSEADRVMFPPLPVESTLHETNDLDIISLVAIVAGAVVCLVVILIVFAAWKWNKNRGPMLHMQMSSRKLPTLPRGNISGPPSPSCQEAMESQVYDGLELGSMNPYMHPYAQSTLPANKQCTPPSSGAPDSDLRYGDNKDDIAIPPPSGEKVKQNHIDGTYTTTLTSYLPMRSPTVLKKSVRKPSSPADKLTSESAFSSVGNNNSAPENADVETALLVDVGNERRSPSDSDDGYYSVPKSSRVASIDETTPALAVY
ncbi:uncharacterized protein LOC580285 isoform X2 [Strongylocentrotus purpuratus]|uniref:Uncharacterized protein n=1 Tax=Strongylocentrotus purpuratus TaxID=7668 RepID=A0A7M7NB03_STRPU|nr:uncharacterized protein LOC580285 isoform X2 [Strongylocentrotus purpuratus]